MIAIAHPTGWSGVWVYVAPDITVRQLLNIESAVYFASLDRWRDIVKQRLDEDAA